MVVARLARWTAAALLMLVGLARSAGGTLLLTRGAALDPAVLAGPTVTRGAGAGLVLVGLGLAVAGVQLLRRRPGAGRLAILALLVFVLDGLLNGTLLYGRPQVDGTLANALVVAVVLGLLWLAREPTPGPVAPADGPDATERSRDRSV